MYYVSSTQCQIDMTCTIYIPHEVETLKQQGTQNHYSSYLLRVPEIGIQVLPGS